MFLNVDHIGFFELAFIPCLSHGCLGSSIWWAQHVAEFGGKDMDASLKKNNNIGCQIAELQTSHDMTCEHEEHVHESCQHQTTSLHEKLQILGGLQYRLVWKEETAYPSELDTVWLPHGHCWRWFGAVFPFCRKLRHFLERSSLARTSS